MILWIPGQATLFPYISVTNYTSMWGRRRMENISFTDHEKNEEVLNKVDEESNIIQTIKMMTSNWIGHVLCRTCFLKHVIEGKKLETEIRRRRCKQLLDVLKETRR